MLKSSLFNNVWITLRSILAANNNFCVVIFWEFSTTTCNLVTL